MPNTALFQRGGNRTGTLQYMAPEVIRREAKDERLDIFSFGVLMFEFLTGKLPYDATDPMGQMRQRINGEPKDINAVAPTLPERAEGDRQQDAGEEPEESLALDGFARQHVEGFPGRKLIRIEPLLEVRSLVAELRAEVVAPLFGVLPVPRPCLGNRGLEGCDSDSRRSDPRRVALRSERRSSPIPSRP